jgi:mycothiol maleylpyruvate isomerase-like protein
MEPQALIDELRAAREDFFASLSAVSEGSLTTPGLVGEWSGRDLVAHLGYWVGHAAEILHEAEQGRIAEIGVGAPPTDDVNATVARIARQTDLATVRRREAASVDALVARLGGTDKSLLDVLLPDGASLAQGIREDSGIHYAEHADELRRALSEVPRG